MLVSVSRSESLTRISVVNLTDPGQVFFYILRRNRSRSAPDLLPIILLEYIYGSITIILKIPLGRPL